MRLWHQASGVGVPLTALEEDRGYGTEAVLPPGAYELEVVAPRRAPARQGPLVLGAGPAADLGDVRLAPRAALLPCDATADPRAWDRWNLLLWSVDGTARALVAELAEPPEPGADQALAAGSYELDLAPDAAHPAWAELAVRGALPAPRRLAFALAEGERKVVALAVGADTVRAAVLPPEAWPSAPLKPVPAGAAPALDLGSIFKPALASCAACH